MSNLSHIIYTSKSYSELSCEQINDLISQARFNNFIYQVTGLLLYGENQFLQVLEGTQSNIDIIFEKIIQDKRHHSIHVTTKNPITERMFINWNMGLVVFSHHPNLVEKLMNQSAHSINFSAISKYDASTLIEPFTRDEFLGYVK